MLKVLLSWKKNNFLHLKPVCWNNSIVGLVDVAVQTKGWLYVSNNVIDYDETFLRCNLLRVAVFAKFLYPR